MDDNRLFRRTLVLATSSIGMSAVLGARARRGAATGGHKQDGGAGEGGEVTPARI